jgi:hypothetical protein
LPLGVVPPPSEAGERDRRPRRRLKDGTRKTWHIGAGRREKKIKAKSEKRVLWMVMRLSADSVAYAANSFALAFRTWAIPPKHGT